INANGATGGGTVRLGGEYLGGIDTGIAPALRFNSQRTLVDRNSLIRVNATNTGAGGRVIVWADDTTGFYGRITGRGATERGGFVEVSGKVNLDFDGRVELPGANGLFGTLLLDPTNITIQNPPGNGDALLPDILVGDVPLAMTISVGALAAISPNTNISLAASNNITINPGVPLVLPDCTVGICGTISFTAGGVFNGAGPVIQARGRDLSITATNITTSVVQTNITLPGRNGGSVTFNATSGNINSSVITSGSDSGIGGAINLTATGNINNTTVLGSGSSSGTSGAMTFNAGGSITLTNADTINTNGNSGAISLTAGNDIDAGTLVSITDNGNGGAINLTAGNNINIATVIDTHSNVTGNGGAINLNAANNIIVIGAGLFSFGTSGNGGAINLTAQGNIIAPDVNTRSTGANGGAVTFNAPQGSITTGTITSLSSTGPGNGGAVNLTSQGNISTSDISSYSNGGNGGAVNLTSQGNISSASIFSYGTGGGNTSGNINVNAANFVRVPNSAICNGLASSLCSAGLGGAGNGAITIRHGGGITTPFTISNASINGTAAAINAGVGASTIPITTIVPAPPAINNYGTNISIITDAPEPPPEVPLDLLLLLINPRPPVTPDTVVVGTPPEPEPIAETPIPIPSPSPIPSPVPTPSPLPTPTPIPIPIPILVPSPTPTPNLSPPP
ncbi:MAG: hypothetical protein HC916_21640, partial [Coleofasciculaceae cyanobacterium SM2_1_6]|nr:hypothetical protein [Coleofasciculaceae cyanobacterium SM2_1_6]